MGFGRSFIASYSLAVIKFQARGDELQPLSPKFACKRTQKIPGKTQAKPGAQSESEL
jgi:hypothetical protein